MEKHYVNEEGQYHHDPSEGETRYPPQEGEQRGPHRKGEKDPHEPLNTPAGDVPPEGLDSEDA
jgi:hypothetical protein